MPTNTLNPKDCFYVVVKIPQVLKIWRAKSAEGINIISVTLEVIALMSTLAYGFANKFPFR